MDLPSAVFGISAEVRWLSKIGEGWECQKEWVEFGVGRDDCVGVGACIFLDGVVVEGWARGRLLRWRVIEK